MKKLLTVILIFSSINVAAGQVWAQYDFQVESAEAQAKIIAASNELMSSEFAKENLKGSTICPHQHSEYFLMRRRLSSLIDFGLRALLLLQ